MVRAFSHTIDNFETMKGEPYNVGLAEANISKLQLCQKIQEHIPDFVFFESEIDNDPDKRNYIVSTEKIEKTGFHAKITMDMGIRELIKAFTILRNSRYGNV